VEVRNGYAVVGGTLVAVGIVLAWFTAAGVRTTLNGYDNSPSLPSLVGLGGCLALVTIGAAIVAFVGSRYGRVESTSPPTRPGGSLRSRGIARPGAVFLTTAGGGWLLLGLLLPVSNLGISHGPLPPYLPPSVLVVPQVVDATGLVLLAGGIALFARGRRRYPNEFGRWWRRTGRVALAVTVAIIVLFAALLLVPVSQSSSFGMVLSGGPGGAIGFTSFPRGVSVTGTWTSVGGPAELNVTDSSGAPIYSVNATGGTFSFVAEGIPVPLYTYWCTSATAVSVQLTFTYQAPYWMWPPGEPGAPT
jgi:hypothetical protein